MEFNATFLIAIISFILFVIIMNYIFYKPIEKIVNERESFVDKNFDEAKKNNLNSQKIISEHDEKINEAFFNGKTIIEDRTSEAKSKKTKILNEAHEKSTEDILINQSELNKTYSETKQSLQSEIEELANKVNEKIFMGVWNE